MIDIVSVSHAMPWQHVLGGVILFSAGAVCVGFALLAVLFPVPISRAEDSHDA